MTPFVRVSRVSRLQEERGKGGSVAPLWVCPKCSPAKSAGWVLTRSIMRDRLFVR